MEGLSESLRYELSLHNILVKLVEPGHFKTGFIRSIGMLNHPAYETQFANYMRWVLNEDDAAPGPKPVAKVIFQGERCIASPSLHGEWPDDLGTEQNCAGCHLALTARRRNDAPT